MPKESKDVEDCKMNCLKKLVRCHSRAGERALSQTDGKSNWYPILQEYKSAIAACDAEYEECVRNCE